MDAKNIHIKAKLDQDFRRFTCQDDYAKVLSTLHTLFQIPEQETIHIKFLDDEGDLCTISSQLEFEFAVAHSTLLKITLFRTPAPTASEPAVATGCPALTNPKMDCLKERLAAVNAKLALPNLPPHKVENLNRRKKFLEAKLSQTAENPTELPAWKFGGGLENKLAGINAKLETADLPPTKKEALLKRKQVLEAKLEQKNGEAPTCKGRGAHLENRLAWITTKLSQPDLPQEKVEKLTRRKECLEAQLKNSQQATDATPTDACPFQPRGRCNNLENRLAWVKTKLDQPDLPPHKVQKLNRRREMLEAKIEARTNGVSGQQPRCQWAAHPAGGRLEARIAGLDAKLQQSDLPDHKKEKLLAKKAWLEQKLKAKQAWNNGTDMPSPVMMPPHPHFEHVAYGMPPHGEMMPPPHPYGMPPMMPPTPWFGAPPMYHPYPYHGHGHLPRGGPHHPHHGPCAHPHGGPHPHHGPHPHAHHRGGCRK